jgi:hypothetical protein
MNCHQEHQQEQQWQQQYQYCYQVDFGRNQYSGTDRPTINLPDITSKFSIVAMPLNILT